MRQVLYGVIVTALLSVSAVVSAQSSDPATLVELGDLYVEAMRLDEAKAAYNQALKLEKKYGPAEVGKAKVDMAREKFEPVKQQCRGIKRRHKATSLGEACEGWFWLAYDRSARAVDEFNLVVEKGDVAVGQTGLGEALRRRAEYDRAIESFRAAIAAGAGYMAHLGLGLTLEAKGDTAGGLGELARAVKIEPASCLAHFHYGRAIGRGPLAVSHLTTALSIRPGWAEAYQELGEVYLANGDFAAAEISFKGSIGAEEKGTAYLGLGKALHAQGKTDDAKEQLNKAIELVPNLVDAYLLLADIEFDAESPDASLKALENARAVAPGVVNVYLHTGQTYHRLGRYTKAKSFLAQAVSMDRNLSIAHSILGDISCERRLYDAGRKHYDDALAGDMKGLDAAEIQKLKAACVSPHP
ncbi:MAG: tetratricopeptide repeat protein [Deltaproteobacteria bacterium]|nr:tetratricopeptide repeat protein [Deltaproteobacteria bacterium]